MTNGNPPRRMSDPRSRIFRLGTFSTGSVLTAAALAIVLNGIGSRIIARLDLTQGRIYSLSPSSRALVKGLEDPVVVKAYFSTNLPSPYRTYAGYVKDLLGEYRSYGRGKLRYEFVSPEDEEKFGREAMQAGVAPLEFQEVGRESVAVKRGYMGLVFYYADRTEVLPVVKRAEGLEYEITSRIQKLVRPGKKVVGITSGSGEPPLQSEIGPAAWEELTRRYEIRSVRLTGGAAPSAGRLSVPAEVDALLVNGPTQRVGEPALTALSDFVMRGRPVAFLLDNARVDLQSFFVNPVETGLDPLLAGWGVALRKGMVLDRQNQQIVVQSRQAFFMIQNYVAYPPFVVSRDVSRTHPLTRDMGAVMLPFVSPVDLALSTGPPNLKGEILARSSNNSWMPRNLFTVNPYQVEPPGKSDPKGPFPLAVVVEGRFPAYRSPVGETDDGKAVVGTDLQVGPPLSPPTRILVIGTSRFASQSYLAQESGLALMLNLVDWLAEDSALLSIRAKGARLRPLRELSPISKSLVRYALVVAMPLTVAALGVAMWRSRKRQLARIAATYVAPSPS